MPPEAVRLGRKRPVPSCPNPLFLQWLSEMRDDAKQKGLKTQYVYQKAINSLKKYPLPLKNGKEAKILQNFGDGICKILDQKLEKHHRENSVTAPVHSLPHCAESNKNKLPSTKSSSHCANIPVEKGGRKISKAAGAGSQEKGGKKKKEYVPQRRSGGYAVLLTLYRHSQIPGSKGFMFKNELQIEAQSLSDKSFIVPDLGSKYTAWSSVSTLIQKNLLLKTHNPARYSLTELGLVLAERLESEERGERHGAEEEQKKSEAEDSGDGPASIDLTLDEDEARCIPRVTYSGSTALISDLPETCPKSESRRSAYLLPGAYDIVLCIDFIETTGGSTARKHELVKELQRNGVTFDIRKLNVGDFLWVAREKVAPVSGDISLFADTHSILNTHAV